MHDARERLKKHITPEIVAALDELFPDRAPAAAASDRQVWIDVGAVQVVRLLKTLLDEIAEDNLPEVLS